MEPSAAERLSHNRRYSSKQHRWFFATLILFMALFYVYDAKDGDVSAANVETNHVSAKTGNPNNQLPQNNSSDDTVNLPHNQPIQILCYGDSLTYGIIRVGNRKDRFPYASFLEAALSKRRDPTTTKKEEEGEEDGLLRVHDLGHPGWTSYDLMYKGKDELDQTLDTYRNRKSGGDGNSSNNNSTMQTSLSMIIILAGTNDFLQRKWQEYNISESVISLHKLALDQHHVPLTVALEIPESKYFVGGPDKSDIAARIQVFSQSLQAFADSEPRTTFVPFPFPFEATDDQERWSGDGL